MPGAKRFRGLLLRLTLNRRVAVVVGSALVAPAAVLLVSDYTWETGATDGLALVALATGIAIAWSGVSGRTPDWYENEN